MSAPPFDPNKTFMYSEDNGDGTVTQTINFPEIGRQIVTVFPGSFRESFDDFVKTLGEGGEATKAFIEELRDKAVDIPDNPDDIIGGK